MSHDSMVFIGGLLANGFTFWF